MINKRIRQQSAYIQLSIVMNIVLFFSHFSIIAGKDQDIFGRDEKSVQQREAMYWVKKFSKSIKDTDKRKAYEALAQLSKIDFTKVSAPLSLLFSICDAVKLGREDFFDTGVKLICTLVMERIASQTLLSIIKAGSLVNADTKKEAIKKLELLKKITSPYKEVFAADIISNINYVQAIIALYPEKSSKFSQLKGSVKIMYSMFKVIWSQDGNALKEIVEYLYNKGKEVYQSGMAEQIATVKLLKKIILSQVAEEGTPEERAKTIQKSFEELVQIHENTKIVEVQAATTRVLMEIVLQYYGNFTQPTSISGKQAYQAFELLLKLTKESRLMGLNHFWVVKLIAVEALLILKSKLALHSKEYTKIIQVYIDEIGVREEEKKEKNRVKVAHFFGLKNKRTRVQVLLDNPTKVVQLLELIKWIDEYTNEVKKKATQLDRIEAKLQQINALLARKNKKIRR